MSRPYGLLGGLAAAALLSAGAFSYLRGRHEINRHVDSYRLHWGDRPPGTSGALRYVALGDSVAQGVGASAVEHGYVARIGRRLAEATGRTVEITNLSVSGATSADVVREQLPQFRELQFTPHVVTLDIGSNDVVFPGHTVSSFETNLDVILEALPAGAFVADVPWFTLPLFARPAQQMSGRAAVLVEQHRHHLVPVHRSTRGVGAWEYHRYTAADWFHPNDLGYEGWEEVFWTVIEGSGVVESLVADPPPG